LELAEEDQTTRIGDVNGLHSAISALDQASQPLAELLMDKGNGRDA
jgi:hypothetical protein